MSKSVITLPGDGDDGRSPKGEESEEVEEGVAFWKRWVQSLEEREILNSTKFWSKFWLAIPLFQLLPPIKKKQ